MTQHSLDQGEDQQPYGAKRRSTAIRNPLLFVIVFGFLGLVLPITGAAFLLSTPQNQSIIVDTLLAWGVGAPVDGQVHIDECHPFQERTGRWYDSGFRCIVEIATPQDKVAWPIAVSNMEGLDQIRSVGRVAGYLGAYNPADVLADRARRLHRTLFFPFALMVAILGMASLIWISARRQEESA